MMDRSKTGDEAVGGAPGGGGMANGAPGQAVPSASDIPWARHTTLLRAALRRRHAWLDHLSKAEVQRRQALLEAVAAVEGELTRLGGDLAEREKAIAVLLQAQTQQEREIGDLARSLEELRRRQEVDAAANELARSRSEEHALALRDEVSALAGQLASERQEHEEATGALLRRLAESDSAIADLRAQHQSLLEVRAAEQGRFLNERTKLNSKLTDLRKRVEEVSAARDTERVAFAEDRLRLTEKLNDLRAAYLEQEKQAADLRELLRRAEPQAARARSAGARGVLGPAPESGAAESGGEAGGAGGGGSDRNEAATISNAVREAVKQSIAALASVEAATPAELEPFGSPLATASPAAEGVEWLDLLAGTLQPAEGDEAFRAEVIRLAGGGRVADAMELLGLAAAMRAPESAGFEHDYEEALRVHAEAAFDRARKASSGAPQEGSARLALRAAVLAPDSPRAWQLLAQTALAEGDRELADLASERAVHLAPDVSWVHEIRAECLIEQSRLAPAFAHLFIAIATGSSKVRQVASALARCFDRLRKQSPSEDWPIAALVDRLSRTGHRPQVLAAVTVAASRVREDPLIDVLIDVAMSESGPPGRSAQPQNRPLVLISQIQRSGGTLLTNLFDGHPELLVHPHEIQVGFPEKWDWPQLDPHASPRDLLRLLFERNIPTLLAKGYVKPDGNRFALEERHPFDFSIPDLCRNFASLLESALPGTSRDILDAYFAAYFAAWHSHEPTGREKWILGFCPRLVLSPESRAGLLRDYPDGHIISCIRNPISWYASISRHGDEYKDLEQTLPLWIDSAESALRTVGDRPERFHLVVYEELVGDPERPMRELCRRLEIGFDDILLNPTYLKRPVLPNSSFDTKTHGVHSEAADRRDKVDPVEVSHIERKAMPLYREIVEAIRRQRRDAAPAI